MYIITNSNKMTTTEKVIAKQDEIIRKIELFWNIDGINSIKVLQSELTTLKAEMENDKPDLKELEKRLDNALNKETKESMDKFLNKGNGLKKFNETEWADPQWKRDQNVNEMIKDKPVMSTDSIIPFLKNGFTISGKIFYSLESVKKAEWEYHNQFGKDKPVMTAEEALERCLSNFMNEYEDYKTQFK